MILNDEEKEKAAQAEIKMHDAYLCLAVAHGYLAASYMTESKTRPTNVECREIFNRECDKAEKLMQEALGITHVGIARYLDDPEPYKRALGSILAMMRITDGYLEGAFNTICRIHKIDPDDARESYRRWIEKSE